MVLHVRAATGVFVKPGSTPSVSLPPLQLPGSPVRKPRRPNKQRFDMLTKYVAGSCAYDLVDELLHAVLIEQPASVLPFLVTYLRKRAAVGKKDPALLGASESSKLEAAPALGAAARRRMNESYVSSQQVNAMLQAMMLELLQAQPASPLAFVTQWLEMKMASPDADRLRIMSPTVSSMVAHQIPVFFPKLAPAAAGVKSTAVAETRPRAVAAEEAARVAAEAIEAAVTDVVRTAMAAADDAAGAQQFGAKILV